MALHPPADLLEDSGNGLYGGWMMVASPTLVHRPGDHALHPTPALRCPSDASPSTAAAIAADLIESIQLHNSLPLRTSTTRNRYVCRPSALADGPTPCGPPRNPTHLIGKAKGRIRTHARSGKGATEAPFFHDSWHLMTGPRNLIPTSQAAVDAARLVAGLYPVPDSPLS